MPIITLILILVGISIVPTFAVADSTDLETGKTITDEKVDRQHSLTNQIHQIKNSSNNSTESDSTDFEDPVNASNNSSSPDSDIKPPEEIASNNNSNSTSSTEQASEQGTSEDNESDAKFYIHECEDDWFSFADDACRGVNTLTDMVISGIVSGARRLGMLAIAIIIATPIPHKSDGSIAFMHRPAQNAIWQGLYDLWSSRVLPTSLFLWAVCILILLLGRTVAPTGSRIGILTEQKFKRAIFMLFPILASWSIVIAMLAVTNGVAMALNPDPATGSNVYSLSKIFVGLTGKVKLNPISVLAWIIVLVCYVILLLLALIRILFLLFFTIAIPLVLPFTLLDIGILKGFGNWANRITSWGIQFILMPLPIIISLRVGYTILGVLNEATGDSFINFLGSGSAAEAVNHAPEAVIGGTFLVIGGIDVLQAIVWIMATISVFLFNRSARSIAGFITGLVFLGSRLKHLKGSNNTDSVTDTRNKKSDWTDRAPDFNRNRRSDQDSKPDFVERRQQRAQSRVLQQTPWGSEQEYLNNMIVKPFKKADEIPETPMSRRAMLRDNSYVDTVSSMDDLPDEPLKLGIIDQDGSFSPMHPEYSAEPEEFLSGSSRANAVYYKSVHNAEDPVVLADKGGDLYDPSPLKLSPPAIRNAVGSGINDVVQIADKYQLPEGDYQMGTLREGEFVHLGDGQAISHEKLLSSSHYQDLINNSSEEVYLRHANSGRIFYDTNGEYSDGTVYAANESGQVNHTTTARALSPTVTESYMQSRGQTPRSVNSISPLLNKDFELVRVEVDGNIEPTTGKTYSGRQIAEPDSEFNSHYQEARANLTDVANIPVGIRETDTGELIDISRLKGENTALENSIAQQNVWDKIYNRNKR